MRVIYRAFFVFLFFVFFCFVGVFFGGEVIYLDLGSFNAKICLV